MTPAPIYHLALRDEWEAAVAEGGAYRRSTLGKSLADQGFIHCSFESQVESTANLIYRGRDDVLLLTIGTSKLGAEVRVENLDGGTALFPHIYGPLPLDAVVGVERMALGDDGRLSRGSSRIRRATAADAAAVADVYVRSRHAAVPDIPPLTPPEEGVRRWLSGVVLAGSEVWVAEAASRAVVALMLLDDDWIHQLYVDPDWTGRGIGAELVAVAKRRSPDGLQLWTFQSNRRAHRFYERHGFTAEERTDGSGNQERAPDVRYAWRPYRE